MEINVSSSASLVDTKINLRVEITVDGVICSFTDTIVEGIVDVSNRKWIESPAGFDTHIHTDTLWLDKMAVVNLTVVAYKGNGVVATTATHNLYR